MTAIPRLTKDHVKKALLQIDQDGVPVGRRSTKFHLDVDGRLYPPKLVISVAAHIATGNPLDPSRAGRKRTTCCWGSRCRKFGCPH